jgi:hypothetical protein
MKKLGFLALAIAGMLFAACSSDKDAVGGGEPNPITVGTKGYFKVNLNLPTSVVSSMRAGWADEGTNMSDGLAKEYAVNSVLLLIFEGATEGAATLKQVINPTESGTPSASDDPNQITAVKEYVAKLDNAPTSNLYALAVINGTGIIEPGSVNTAVKINGGADASDITLADLQVATSNPMITSDKFFMTNAVLSKVQGGDEDPGASPALQILAPIKAEYIYETQADAAAGNPATDIYVERGVAKVTVDVTAIAAAALKTKDGAGVTPSFEGWVLDNTETNSYIVRKVPTTFTWNLKSVDASVTTDPYRFIGGNAVDKLYGTKNYFRTYWAEDPNYDNVAVGKTTTTTPTFPAKTEVGESYPQYCHENTFDVAHQTHQNTTRAIVKVNLSANDFYTIGADRKTLYTLDNVKDLVVTDLMDQSIFATWWATQSTLTLTAADLTITFSSTDAGIVTVSDITIDKAKCDKTTPATDPSINTEQPTVITTLNNSQLSKVEYFKGGVSYYEIRIKHFGDDLTPWNSAEYGATKPVTGDVDAIYPNNANRDNNYLGRYGMVRNNWYDIHIGEILKVGSSTVPVLPGDDTPDDDLDELYIKARINILSWAKRVQNWTLK